MKSLLLFTTAVILSACGPDKETQALEKARRESERLERSAESSARIADAADEIRERFMKQRDQDMKYYEERRRSLRSELPQLPPGGRLEAALLEIREAEEQLEKIRKDCENRIANAIQAVKDGEARLPEDDQ